MFPTPVGMNRNKLSLIAMLRNVPHTRGDEPYDHRKTNQTE